MVAAAVKRDEPTVSAAAAAMDDDDDDDDDDSAAATRFRHRRRHRLDMPTYEEAQQSAAAAAPMDTSENDNAENRERQRSEFERQQRIIQEDAWVVIDSFFEQNTPATQQLQSYNEFIQNGVARIIGNITEVTFEGMSVWIDPSTLYFDTPRVPLHASSATIQGSAPPSLYSQDLLYPSEARLRKFTYEAQFFCDVRLRHYVKHASEETIRVDKEEVQKRVPIGSIPVMVRSILCNLAVDYTTFRGETERMTFDAHQERHRRQKDKRAKECAFDTGGYFIINGVERVVIPQERLAANQPYTFRVKSPSSKSSSANDEGGESETVIEQSSKDYVIEVLSHDFEGTGDGVAISKFSIYAKSIQTYRSQERISKDYSFTSQVILQCQLSGLMRRPVLLPVLLRALGMTDDLEIMCLITEDPEIIRNIDQDTDFRKDRTRRICKLVYDSIVMCNESGIKTVDAALDHIGRRCGFESKRLEERIELTRKALRERLLPHLGSKTPSKKYFYVCYMANRLLTTVLGFREVDNRDSFMNKRVQHTGQLLESLLYQSLKALTKRVTGSMRSYWEKRKVFDAIDFFRTSSHIRQSMRYALGTGNWSTSHSQSFQGGAKTGVTQALNAINYFGRIAMMNKLHSSAGDQGKVIKARQLHNTSFGIVCPCETPEGHQIGVVKNTSILAHVSSQRNKQEIVELVSNAALFVTASRYDPDSDYSDDDDDDDETPNTVEQRRRNGYNANGYQVSLFDDDDTFTADFSEDKAELLEQTKIFVNGDWIGSTSKPKHLTRALRTLRRHSNALPGDVSIYFDVFDRSIQVWCDAGRLSRPLYIVDKGNRLRIQASHIDELRVAIIERRTNFVVDAFAQNTRLRASSTDEHRRLAQRLVFGRGSLSSSTSGDADTLAIDDDDQHRRRRRGATWQDLFDHGLVELIDVCEANYSMVAMHLEDLVDGNSEHGYCSTYTHCEIHPATIFGISASLIPFPDHNQSPRNTYQSAMCKQAQGVLLTQMRYRIDTIAYELWYPQKPIVTTRMANNLHYSDLPAGINAIVAVACYTGYNQEDSVLMNKAAIDRGFMRSSSIRSYTEVCKTYRRDTGVREEFELPDRASVYGMRAESYGKLDADGTPEVGALFGKGDAFLGKVLYHPERVGVSKRHGQFTYFKTDASLIYSHDVPARCAEVILTTNERNERMVTVVFKSMRIPTIGDKFSSRHGQKGTVGMIYNQEDMPFTAEGIVPDIVMNPHAVPSRMTIGQLVEAISGKVAALSNEGNEVDATPFTDLTVDQISTALHSVGYESKGYETMYCGMTGRPLKAKIFIGPTFYQRLRHMADDKIQSRSRGPKSQLTRQPVQGKARGGGIRFGEMERDCIIAHGGSAFLKDRMLDNSDSYMVKVCGNCGLMGAVVKTAGSMNRDYDTCRVCKTFRYVYSVRLPYAFKLLCQELMSMGVAPRLMIPERDLGPGEVAVN